MGPSSDFMTWPLCVSVLCSSAFLQWMPGGSWTPW
jgi:hypothetical protein